MICRCGCGRQIRTGNVYASQGCSRRARVRGKGPGITIIARPKKLASEAPTDSWWAKPELHQDRSAFMAEAYAKFPTVTPPIRLSLDRSAGGRSDL